MKLGETRACFICGEPCRHSSGKHADCAEPKAVGTKPYERDLTEADKRKAKREMGAKRWARLKAAWLDSDGGGV